MRRRDRRRIAAFAVLLVLVLAIAVAACAPPSVRYRTASFPQPPHPGCYMAEVWVRSYPSLTWEKRQAAPPATRADTAGAPDRRAEYAQQAVQRADTLVRWACATPFGGPEAGGRGEGE